MPLVYTTPLKHTLHENDKNTQKTAVENKQLTNLYHIN